MSLFRISLVGMDSQRYLDLDCIRTLSKRLPQPHNCAWATTRPIEQAGSQSDNQATPRQDHRTQSANRKPSNPIGQLGIRALNRPVGQNSCNRALLPNRAQPPNRAIGQNGPMRISPTNMKSIQHIDIQIGRLAVNLPDWKSEMCFRKASKTRLQIGNKLGTSMRAVHNLFLGIHFQLADRAITN